ncbi:MAG TPA: beta-(1-6) glucans synthase [Xanthobacteraceae bacterium]|jgi:glucan 1,3-beta-glucosidase
MISSMGMAGALLAATAALIVGDWVWLGSAVQMPASPLAPSEKVHCVSYAPFRGEQTPLGPEIAVDPGQIEQDLAQLKAITNCVRTYSIDHGLDQIAGMAKRHGLEVLQGLWLSSFPERNRRQIETTVELARRYPDVIKAIVVGNEVLLRGELSSPDLASTIREVKRRVTMPVTYADVWELWLRHPEIAPEVDFITIHILPYWEDFPIPAGHAAEHVDAIRQRVAASFPGKEILVGEFGWPSAGRMREGALPSPVNQARTMHEVLSMAKRNNYRVNLIEAYDQPWKRELEGTVGGHWGMLDAYRRVPKFSWGGTVSDRPLWPWQAAGGIALAAVTFLAAYVCRPAKAPADLRLWLPIAATALASGGLVGWTIVNVPLESLTLGDWLRSLGWAGTAILAPVLAGATLASGRTVPSFAEILSRRARAAVASKSALELAAGALLIATAVLSVQAALGLVFDPRYRDFPFAPLTGAVIPFLFLAKWRRRPRAGVAELVMAALLAAAAVYIVLNEGLANWQACWFAAGLAALVLILVRAPAVPG